LRKYLIRLLLPSTIIVFWHIAVTVELLPPSVSASPIMVFKTAISLLVNEDLALHTLLSFLRLTLGSTLGICLGLFLGLLAVTNKLFDSIFSPTIGFIAPIPAVVWLPFAVMVFGTGEVYKLFLPFFITFLLVYIQTLQGIKTVSNNYFEVARIYEKTKLEIARKVIVPAVLPSIFTGIKVALAIGWIAIFIVEFSSADPNRGGLGWYIADAREVGRIEDQFAGALVLGLVGYLTDKTIDVIQKRNLRWSKPPKVNSLTQ